MSFCQLLIISKNILNLNKNNMIEFSADSQMEDMGSGGEKQKDHNTDSNTPILDNFSRDLTFFSRSRKA